MPSKTITRNLIRKVSDIEYETSLLRRWRQDNDFTFLPKLQATLDVAYSAINTAGLARVFTNANKLWTLSGTNAADAGSTLHATVPGVTLATAGANNDQMCIRPATLNGGAIFLNTLGQGILLPSKQPIIAARLLTAASIAAIKITFGARLVGSIAASSTCVFGTGTDNDLVQFTFDTSGSASTTGWLAEARNAGGTAVSKACDTRLSQSTVAASTAYDLRIQIDGSQNASFYINNQLAATIPAAVASSAALIPFIGLQALTGAAKTVTAQYLSVSRLW